MALGWNWVKFPTAGAALEKFVEYVNTNLKMLDNVLGRTPVYYPNRDVSADYTVVDSDELIRADGTLTVILPPATNWTGRQVTVKNVGSGTVTIQGTGGDQIDGASTAIIARPLDVVQVRWNGSSWDRIITVDRNLVVQQNGVQVVADTTTVNVVGATVTESPAHTAVVTITPLTVEDEQETPVVVTPTTTLHVTGNATVEDGGNGEAILHVVQRPLVVKDAENVAVVPDTRTLRFTGSATTTQTNPYEATVNVASGITYAIRREGTTSFSAGVISSDATVDTDQGVTLGTWTTSSTSITVPVTGWYLLSGGHPDATTSPPEQTMSFIYRVSDNKIFANGVGNGVVSAGGNVDQYSNACCAAYLVAGDEIRLFVRFHPANGGGVTELDTYLSLVKLA